MQHFAVTVVLAMLAAHASAVRVSNNIGSYSAPVRDYLPPSGGLAAGSAPEVIYAAPSSSGLFGSSRGSFPAQSVVHKTYATPSFTQNTFVRPAASNTFKTITFPVRSQPASSIQYKNIIRGPSVTHTYNQLHPASPIPEFVGHPSVTHTRTYHQQHLQPASSIHYKQIVGHPSVTHTYHQQQLRPAASSQHFVYNTPVVRQPALISTYSSQPALNFAASNVSPQYSGTNYAANGGYAYKHKH